MAPGRSLMGFAAAALAPLLLLGCIQDPPPPAAGTPVFVGGFAVGVEPKAFGDSRLNALGIDSYQTFGGEPSIRIEVPLASATPGYAGGPFEAAVPQDLSRNNALAFWTRASRGAVLDKLGYGLVFEDPSVHQVTLFGLPLTDAWTHHVIPIPDPARLTAERGLFWYADNDPVNYTFWLADMAFVQVDEQLLDLQPSLGAANLTVALNRKAAVPLVLTYVDLDGTRRALDYTDPGAGPAPSYFGFTSSDSSVATVDATGTITGIATGRTFIQARLRGKALPGDLTVDVVASIPAPTAGPPLPTHPAADVTSLFSNSYTPAITGINFGTSWSNSVNGVECGRPNCANLSTPVLAGDDALKYTGLNFVGVDFAVPSKLIDASTMTHFHVDVWTPDASKFGVQLVGFPDATSSAVGAGVARTVSFNMKATYLGTVAPMTQGTWISLDIPLSLFGDLPRSKIGQILWLDNPDVAGGGVNGGTFYVDNFYFHR